MLERKQLFEPSPTNDLIVFIISLTYLIYSNMMKNKVSFNSTWELLTGSSWEKIRWCKEPIDIFIDEAQIAYGTTKYFLGRIKDLLTIPNDNVRILLLRYPSLVRETLKSLYGHFRRNGSRTDDMLHHLVSKEYFFAINSLRVFDAIVQLEMTDANITFLRDAYHSINNDSTFVVDLANDMIDGLKHSGLIIEASSGALMQFAAPLVRVVLGRKLFTTRMSLRSRSPSRSDTELDAFIMLSIERMHQSTLKHSLSHNILTALLSRGFISLDVGPVFGSRGYLDFYIDEDLQWGVEIMREGSRMAEHIDRFSPSGRYTRIPCSQWRIIDFRHHSKSPGELEENITVLRKGYIAVKVTLAGDKLQLEN
ncbi:hypothetical protein BGX38DRAFT_1215227 [Terfezia claveryi]|nr:hypothetical protein BGX38DRAFT_1215227 [Terfezia claveryi]